jgi:hypothetical protein
MIRKLIISMIHILGKPVNSCIQNKCNLFIFIKFIFEIQLNQNFIKIQLQILFF